MRKKVKTKNIFADKATLILRKMLCEPERKWVVRDFIGAGGVSLGLAQGVLESMTGQGYIERVKKGPDSYALLTNSERLIEGWIKEYQFDLNEVYTYYAPDKNVLNKIKVFLKKDKYALTLHSGANLVTSYVKTDQLYLYLNFENWNKEILELRQKLDLKELVRGGNFHIARPFYKNSIFFNCQNIKGYRIVSNLQMYLDLYNFQPRGREHAEYLKKLIEEKGRCLD